MLSKLFKQPPTGQLVPHEYGPSTVGHGEAQCVWCKGTNRENAVIDPNHCEARARLDARVKPVDRQELAKQLAARRKWRHLWSEPGMDRVCAVLNSEPTWDEIKSAELIIKDIEELGYDFKRKETANAVASDELGARQHAQEAVVQRPPLNEQ